jgi:hypothetical protein
MGTSSPYGGPTGKNPLLPDWADSIAPDADSDAPEGADEDSPNEAEETTDGSKAPQVEGDPTPPQSTLPIVSWSGCKNLLSRRANGDSSVSYDSIFKSYAKARGGARTAARASSSGKASTRNIGGFLAGIVRDGVVEAARQFGLGDLLGREASSALAAFIDMLAPAGALLEDAIARAATIETLDELFRRYEVSEQGVTALNSLDADGIKEMVTVSVVNYVNERFQNELINCVERGSLSERAANDLMIEAKHFIVGVVALDFEGVDVVSLNWQGAEGKRFVERIYESAYSLLGS